MIMEGVEGCCANSGIREWEKPYIESIQKEAPQYPHPPFELW
jgi:hypothetical protein